MAEEQGGEPKTKAQLKAERRAKQEAQRAAKAAGVKLGEARIPQKSDGAAESAKPSKSDGGAAKQKEPKPQPQPAKKDANITKQIEDAMKSVKVGVAPSSTSLSSSEALPPGIFQPFIQFQRDCHEHTIAGPDEQCVEFINVLSKFSKEVPLSADKEFTREFESLLKVNVTQISGGHPLPAACGNLLRQLKQRVQELAGNNNEKQCRQQLVEWLEDYKSERIDLATDSISLQTQQRLLSSASTSVMVYSWCSITEKILLESHAAGIRFDQVCVLDSAPKQQGKRMLDKLVKADITCSYGLISSIAYIIKHVDLVLLGADAILANGCLLARLGAAQLALVAKAHNIPVLVACPTHKFVDKTITSSTAVMNPVGLNCEQQEIVPADLITGIITEMRILPPSSAPAVLRVKQQSLV